MHNHNNHNCCHHGEHNHDEHKDHNHHDHHSHHDHEHHETHGHHDHGGHEHHAHHGEAMIRDFTIRTVVVLVTLVLTLVIPNQTLVTLIGFTGLGYGAWPFVVSMINEIRRRSIGMMTLIGIAVVASAIYNALLVFGVITGTPVWVEILLLVVAMLVGHIIEMKAVGGMSDAVAELLKLLPNKATVLRGKDKTEEVHVHELKPGDVVIVRSGERVPADGIVVEGEAVADMSAFTGESVPVPIKKGESVLAGTLLVEGSLHVKISKSPESFYLKELADVLSKVRYEKVSYYRLADKASFYLTVVALVVAILTFIVWSLISSPVKGIEYALAVLVIACPHALGVAIPLVTSRAVYLLTKHGIIIKNVSVFERLRGVDKIAIDKTGTLTYGNLVLSDVYVLDKKMKKEKILQLVATLELYSNHPIAKALRKWALPDLKVDKLEVMVGRGMQGVVNGKHVLAVSMEEFRKQFKGKYSDKVKIEGSVAIGVAIDGKPVAVFTFEDKLREDAHNLMKVLKELKIDPVLISGDRKDVVEKIAKQLGIKEYYSDVKPDDKVKIVESLQKKGHKVIMMGDGINDAASLAKADVGIAVATGTDVTKASADVIVTGNLDTSFKVLWELSNRAYRKIRQNLFWAFGYNVITIPTAAGVFAGLGLSLPPALAALLMAVSTVIVSVNARLLREPRE